MQKGGYATVHFTSQKNTQNKLSSFVWKGREAKPAWQANSEVTVGNSDFKAPFLLEVWLRCRW